MSDSVPYTVSFNGTNETELLDVMRGASQLVALQDKSPRTLKGVERRANDDAERFTEILRSKGFYAGSVDAAVTRTDHGAEVSVRVEPDVVYLIGDVVIEYGESPPPEDLQPAPDELGLHIGDYAEADKVIAAETALITHFKERGYPEARAAKRRVTVDHSSQTMTVYYRLETGPSVTYGATRFKDSATVKASYLNKLVPWQIGDTYKASQVEAFRRRLRETGLFGSVSIEFEGIDASQRTPIDEAPVVVSLSDAAQRAVGAGADYSTSTGPGVKVFWEHRNALSEAETVRVSASANTVEQTLVTDFRKPEFIVGNQDLVSRAALEREDSDAYESVGIDTRLGFERRSGKIWKTGVFASAEFSEVSRDDDEQLVKLVGLPVYLERDTTDSLLDPAQGTRLGLYATPYAGHGDKALAFGVIEARASGYVALDDDRDVVLAGRSRIGSIVGESRDDLPADKRFYAGGGGSVRGYGFRLAGPLDTNNDPEGGRSTIELGAELRLKVSESIGFVPFLEGGGAQAGLLPTSLDDLLWAAGLGFRYFTPIGPIRLDVAAPLDRRDVDDPFQFYVSIGQAF
ncbi:MAG: BamA/TamA family outer membrane protein [Rhodospirillales bacterium]